MIKKLLKLIQNIKSILFLSNSSQDKTTTNKEKASINKISFSFINNLNNL